MGGHMEVGDLMEQGLLTFFAYSANANSHAHILSELKKIVHPQSVSAFEDIFLKVKVDMDEPDGAIKIQKLFADFEIALQRTNLSSTSQSHKYA
jgi:hypothetical protein